MKAQLELNKVPAVPFLPHLYTILMREKISLYKL